MLYIVIKTFCGILFCRLDVLAIIKRNGIGFHDSWWIVKYAHFSILLLLSWTMLVVHKRGRFLLLLLLAQVTYNQVQPLQVDQLPGQLVSTQIRIRGPNYFKFHHSIGNAQHKHCINRWVTVWFYTFYIIRPALLEQNLLRRVEHMHTYSTCMPNWCPEHNSASHMNF